eukprot:7044348-Prymnesium_polylepis.1
MLVAPSSTDEAPTTFSMAYNPPTSRYADRVSSIIASSDDLLRISDVECALHGGDPIVTKAPVARFSRLSSAGLRESP